MVRQALYLKWRSQTFEEIIGQEHVTRTLRNALERDKIAHAYLFCGPRGTGKTSMARILAKAVNCLSETQQRPCNQCAICRAINDGSLMDLVEVDAASNTGVDDVRDLREKVAFRPSQAQYKVYVIDEVHMLSTSAFNALLKTLEEPPQHVIFILATTDPQKIPATILSRCQRFDFRYVPTTLIADHLRRIADAEELRIEPEAINLIAAQAAGGMRDGVSLLDQLAAYGDVGITAEQVRSILGIGSGGLVADFVEALVGRDLPAGLAVVDRLVDQGVQLRQFTTELLEYLRGMLLQKAGGSLGLLHLDPDATARLSAQAGRAELADLIRFGRLFSEAAQGLRSSLQPQLPLELAFLEATSMAAHAASGAAQRPATSVPTERRHVEADAAQAVPAATPASKTPTETEPAVRRPEPVLEAVGELNLDAARRTWKDLLARLRTVDFHTQALLNSALVSEVQGSTLAISFKNDFSKHKFETSENAMTLTVRLLSEMLGQPVTIRCVLTGSAAAPAPKWQPVSTPTPKPAAAQTGVSKPQAAKEEKPKRETAPKVPTQEAAALDDPVIRAAVDQLGARVVKVIANPPAPAMEEPPWLDEPPPEDE